jgi:hypothetical protein
MERHEADAGGDRRGDLGLGHQLSPPEGQLHKIPIPHPIAPGILRVQLDERLPTALQEVFHFARTGHRMPLILDPTGREDERKLAGGTLNGVGVFHRDEAGVTVRRGKAPIGI